MGNIETLGEAKNAHCRIQEQESTEPMTVQTTEKNETVQRVPTASAAMVKVNGAGKGEFRESRDVPMSEIVVTPEFNTDPRRMTDETSIRMLARSIEATGGLLQNVLLGAVTEDGKTTLHLISGFRRFAAYKSMGKKSIPATIRVFDTLAALLANGAENTGREAPHPFALAKRMAFIKETHYKGDKEADSKIAESFGVTKKHVQNLLRMYRNLSPKLRKVLEGPSASLSEESVTLKWLIEQAKEDHETQDAAWEVRFGEGAGEDEDEDKPKKKKGKKDEDDGKAKKPRMRNRDEIIWARDKTFKPLTEAQIKAGNDVCFKLNKLGEGKFQKITDRDRLIVREVMSWVMDANRKDFFLVTEPEEETSEEDE